MVTHSWQGMNAFSYVLSEVAANQKTIYLLDAWSGAYAAGHFYHRVAAVRRLA